MSKFKNNLFNFIILILFQEIIVIGNVLNVPEEYSTIQCGLDSALAGDTVLVQPGIYYENIIWPFKNGIKLFSIDIPDSTIIDGSNNGSVIYISVDSVIIDTSTIIKGFKIQNGNSHRGGGIYIGECCPILQNLIITNNKAYSGGGITYSSIPSSQYYPCWSDISIINNTSNLNAGGIYCYGDLLINNFQIDKNGAKSTGGGFFGHGNFTFINGTFCGNNVNNDGDYNYTGKGAAIYISGSIIRMENVSITSNFSWNDYGLIYAAGSIIDIINSEIHWNSEYQGYCGGIYIKRSNLNIQFSTITNNSASAIKSDESTIICKNSTILFYYNILDRYYCANGLDLFKSKLLLINTILYGDPYGVRSAFYNIDDSSQVYLFNSLILDSELPSGIILNNNNLLGVDPLLVDVYNKDFSLQDGSPCINAGTDFILLNNDTLLSLKSTQYIGTAPDIGAIESQIENLIDNSQLVPKDYLIFYNYPNPFNNTTNITYNLLKMTPVTIKIFDIKGNLISTLIDHVQQSGCYQIKWNSENLSTGIYFYQIETSYSQKTKKMLLIK